MVFSLPAKLKAEQEKCLKEFACVSNREHPQGTMSDKKKIRSVLFLLLVACTIGMLPSSAVMQMMFELAENCMLEDMMDACELGRCNP